MSSSNSFHDWLNQKAQQCAKRQEERTVTYLRGLEEEAATKDLEKYDGKGVGSAKEQPAST